MVFEFFFFFFGGVGGGGDSYVDSDYIEAVPVYVEFTLGVY